MSIKHSQSGDYQEIVYDSNHWRLFECLREKAVFLLSALTQFHLYAIVHGSVARGDVKANSDIDVFISDVSNSFLVETALTQAGIKVNRRYVVQATPTYAMKAHLEIDEVMSVSFPLMSMRKVEREFYMFGGEIDLAAFKTGLRVAGVDKRLMLIEPNAEGHVESSIIGREAFAAKTLGVSVETVLDRVRALTKRDMFGRTGVFIKKELMFEETFELALKRLSDFNPAVRRRIKKF
ncbi:MAG: nucleotidyltransferase domain-containing protein [Candidatus Bathyarchaeota archaeon]|nr:nucleotidyltransferase domain-containing protein [Candidatus Termiticorpusculum sp.]